MPKIDLIPLCKGNALSLDDGHSLTLGRSPTIGCLDNKISRNHALLFLKADGSVWIKPLHHNPTFFKTRADQVVSLTQNKEYQLHDNDEFGLLPDEYFYRVSIKAEDEPPAAVNTSTVPKSPVRAASPPTLVDNTARDNEPEPVEEKAPAPAPVRRRIHASERKPTELAYGDSDEDEPVIEPAVATAAAATSADARQRDRCPYGETCYRKNLAHRQEVSHPGDPDWEVKETAAKKTKPDCPYGSECYRKNAEHLNEYQHPRKKCIELPSKSRRTKGRVSEDDEDDDDEDDDDGLPNTYDYNDSFIDDKDLALSDTTDDEQASVQSDGDTEWKPKSARDLDDSDDCPSDESERELRDREAARFIKRRSSSDNHRSTKKKRRRDDDD